MRGVPRAADDLGNPSRRFVRRRSHRSRATRLARIATILAEPDRLRAGRTTRTACPPAATAPRFATPSLRPPRLLPARVHHRTSVCGRARRCAQINTDRSNGASDAASDAADDLAASMQVSRVSVFVGGFVSNRMILLLAMITGQPRGGRGPRRQPPAARARFGGISKKARVIAASMPIARALGWVLGDVAAGGRQYFYVPVPAHAATYRPTVQRFDKVILEGPAPQGP